MTLDLIIGMATKGLLYAAALLAVGAATAFCVVMPQLTDGAETTRRTEEVIRRVGLCASIALVLALVLHGWSYRDGVRVRGFDFAGCTLHNSHRESMGSQLATPDAGGRHERDGLRVPRPGSTGDCTC